MDVRLSSEQQLLADTAARLGAQHATPGIDHLPPTPHSTDEAWAALGQAGFLGIAGDGAGVASALISQQLAATLSPAPYLGQSVLPATLLTIIGAHGELIQLADGSARYCVLLSRDLMDVAGPDEPAVAFDAADATHGLTIDSRGAVYLHALPALPAGGLDLTRRTLTDVRPLDGLRVGDFELDEMSRDRLRATSMTMLAADQLGLMDCGLQLAVAHAGQRRQFGRVIGANQALAHVLSDAAVLVEAARSCVWHAAWALDSYGLQHADRVLEAARQAKAFSDSAAREVLEAAVQVHGGIAITWEHVIPLMLRRALFNAQLFGAPGTQYAALAQSRQHARRVPEPVTGGDSGYGGLSFADSAEELAFRQRLRAWLAKHAPADPPASVSGDQRMTLMHHWHQNLAAAGFVGLSFPREYGGHGLSLLYDAILNDELAASGAPAGPAINHISNAIRLFGSEAQKQEYLPGMLACTVRWCQGFSEPEAGSDLASLRTRGSAFTGDDGQLYYRIEGQKLWTSEAVWADWCLLLLRTETEGRPHQQLSMLLVPMDTPGLECRPVRTAYGSSEFAEVFFTGAVVPAGQLLGRAGQGWEIAMALLGFERGPADMGWTARLQRLLARAEARIQAGAAASAPQRADLAHAWVELEALRLQVLRSTSNRLDGSAPGPEGSLDKLLMTRAEQRLGHVLVDLAGASGVLDDSELFSQYVWSRAQAIFGGSRQIQRDLVAQRVLGLPRPPS